MNKATEKLTNIAEAIAEGFGEGLIIGSVVSSFTFLPLVFLGVINEPTAKFYGLSCIAGATVAGGTIGLVGEVFYPDTNDIGFIAA